MLMAYRFALIEAAKEGNVAVVKELLQRNDVQNEVNLAFLEASNKKHRECQTLLQNHCHAGYLQNILTNNNTTLTYAAQQGDLWNLRSQILSGVKLDSKTGPCLKTALMYAAQFNHPDCVLDLIGCGANINELDDSKQTALFYAARSGNMDVLKVLIQNKADTQIKNRYGQTADFYMSQENAIKFKGLLSDIEKYGDVITGMLPSLQHLARAKIRQHLINIYHIDRDFKNLVQLVGRLPLPTCTQHYLLFLST